MRRTLNEANPGNISQVQHRFKSSDELESADLEGTTLKFQSVYRI